MPESEITWLLQVTDRGSCVPAAVETGMEMLSYREHFPSQNPSVCVQVEPSSTKEVTGVPVRETYTALECPCSGLRFSGASPLQGCRATILGVIPSPSYVRAGVSACLRPQLPTTATTTPPRWKILVNLMAVWLRPLWS